MSRQVRNHLADSRTTSLTCKALRRCPSAILAEPTQRNNCLSLLRGSTRVARDGQGQIEGIAKGDILAQKRVITQLFGLVV